MLRKRRRKLNSHCPPTILSLTSRFVATALAHIGPTPTSPTPCWALPRPPRSALLLRGVSQLAARRSLTLLVPPSRRLPSTRQRAWLALDPSFGSAPLSSLHLRGSPSGPMTDNCAHSDYAAKPITIGDPKKNDKAFERLLAGK